MEQPPGETVKDGGSSIDPQLAERISKFSKHVTKVVSGNDPNLHTLFGWVEIGGKMRTTGRQATGFVLSTLEGFKLTVRQTPDSELGAPSAYVPAELVAFRADDYNASYFDARGTVAATMTGDGGLFNHTSQPVRDRGEFAIVEHFVHIVFNRLQLPTPAEIFPDHQPARLPEGLVIPRI